MTLWEDFWRSAHDTNIQEVAQRIGAKLKPVGADWIGPCVAGCAKRLANGVPEPSTWAMMLLGFAGPGYAGFRRTSKITLA
jgi:PEP-CTERM motif